MTPTQLFAVFRPIVGFLAGLVCGMIVMAFIGDAEKATNDIVKILGALTALVSAAVPIYNAIKAKEASSPTGQAKSLAENIDKVSNGARNAIINAVSTMPEVNKVIATSDVAHATTSEKVVAE